MSTCVNAKGREARGRRLLKRRTYFLVRARVVNGDARLKSYGSSKRYGIP